MAARSGPELAPVEVGDDLASDPDAVPLVDREVVGEPRDPRVHRGAAELLVVGHLAGGHLDQGRAAEEHLGPPVDEHRVVAHRGHVRAAGGGVAEDQRDGGDPQRRELGEVAEDLPGGDEEVGLGGEIGAAGLDEVDDREAVHAGDLERARSVLPRV